MKRALASATIVLVLSLVAVGTAVAHCQIPCGIYGDMMRIDMLLEDVQTIEKSISSIQALSGKTDAADVNQLVRWVENKDTHADRIGEIVTEYFLRQRIKAPAAGASAEQAARYVEQLKVLHGLLVVSMKAKQTVDPAIPGQLRDLVEQLKQVYFSKEDLAHAAEHTR